MFDEQSYLQDLALSASDREAVVATLRDFPASCRSRGMFFLGILDLLKREKGGDEATLALGRVGISYRISHFGLHPHRDFYRLFFYVARRLHPHQPLGVGLERVAESFFPIFAGSLAGRTLIALLDKDPAKVLARFVDAYGIACPSNTHRFVVGEGTLHRWSCSVEPCPLYPFVFQGICRGMVKAVTGVEPVVSVAEKLAFVDAHQYEFDITLR